MNHNRRTKIGRTSQQLSCDNIKPTKINRLGVFLFGAALIAFVKMIQCSPPQPTKEILNEPHDSITRSALTLRWTQGNITGTRSCQDRETPIQLENMES